MCRKIKYLLLQIIDGFTLLMKNLFQQNQPSFQQRITFLSLYLGSMDFYAEIFLKCFSIAGKLRVRIITAGYNNNANCQFPRSIRQLDRVYTIPMRNISIAQSNKGTYFYRVKNKDINIVSE